MASKSCGSCQNWTRVKSIKGLCEVYDYGWCPANHVEKGCSKYKPLKYKRDSSKISIKQLED